MGIRKEKRVTVLPGDLISQALWQKGAGFSTSVATETHNLALETHLRSLRQGCLLLRATSDRLAYWLMGNVVHGPDLLPCWLLLRKKEQLACV